MKYSISMKNKKRGFAHGSNVPNERMIIEFFNLHTRKKNTSSGFSIEPLPIVHHISRLSQSTIEHSQMYTIISNLLLQS
jgi:hypothetical protein